MTVTEDVSGVTVVTSGPPPTTAQSVPPLSSTLAPQGIQGPQYSRANSAPNVAGSELLVAQIEPTPPVSYPPHLTAPSPSYGPPPYSPPPTPVTPERPLPSAPAHESEPATPAPSPQTETSYPLKPTLPPITPAAPGTPDPDLPMTPTSPVLSEPPMTPTSPVMSEPPPSPTTPASPDTPAPLQKSVTIVAPNQPTLHTNRVRARGGYDRYYRQSSPEKFQ